ncbi:MAG: radical SAM protein [Chloroflexi bacterium]|nr:radical SAM protein [Chloroflexota bacterium]
MSHHAKYMDTQCRTALNRVRGMGFRWSLNPYRGCVHGCHYCFARRYNAFNDLNPSDDFSGLVFVKSNIVDVLRAELSRPSWPRDVVAIGTATDPYQPIEGARRLTRGCLEALAERRTPLQLVTKGTLVQRDVDVLADACRRAGASVSFSITTLDPDLWRDLEPGTPPPWKRLQVMERLVAAGVRAGVLLAPVVPGVTDSHESLAAVVEAAAAHGAHFLHPNVLHLQPGTREHFMDYLSRRNPRLHYAYQRLYTEPFAPNALRRDVEGRVSELMDTHGLRQRRHDWWQPPQPARQLALAGV